MKPCCMNEVPERKVKRKETYYLCPTKSGLVMISYQVGSPVKMRGLNVFKGAPDLTEEELNLGRNGSSLAFGGSSPG